MTTTTAEIVTILRERILSGDMPPGARMHQVQLSETLGFSRTPLREALSKLTAQGLLVYEPNRGYAVRSFSTREIRAAFEVRGRLEALACYLCSKAGLSNAVIEQLLACIETGDQILAKGVLDPADLAPYRQMNVELHETIIQQSDNVFLGDFVHQCHNVPLASDRVFVWENHEVIARSHDDHRRIVQAIMAREADRAEYLMREHIHYAGQILLAKLDSK